MVKNSFGISGYININGLNFKGSWNANTNNPFLQSSVGTNGDYYIVSVAGTTNLNGTFDWQIGDWALFEGATNMWQKVDNHDVQAYTIISEEGVALPQQSILDFQGLGVTATNGVGKTIVTVPIQQAYNLVQAQGISLAQRTTLNFTGGLTASDVGGVTTVNITTPTNYGLYAQYQNSTPITNTTVESSLIGLGFGTLSVPANGFSVGDSFRCDFGGVMSSKNNETIRIKIKSGSVILADSGIQNLSGITNEVWQISINFTVRAIGGVGVASIVTLGVFHINKTSNNTPSGFAWNTVNSTTFDTTITNTLDVTAQWGSASALDNIYSDIFVLNKIY